MRKTLRYFRIAWTAFCGMVAVLVVVLWVRSYTCLDEYWFSIPFNRGLGFISASGFGSISIESRPNPEMFLNGYHKEDIKISKGLMPRSHLGVYLVRDRDVSAIGVRFWLFLLFVGSFALAPWLRFGLRTLMLTTSTIAILLGLIVWLVRR